jgi:hypothetical protein
MQNTTSTSNGKTGDTSKKGAAKENTIAQAITMAFVKSGFSPRAHQV